ncbi:oxidoreductase [Siccirubricoccus deserti]|uniref:NAD(P)-dependent oxidoreductase n=1 Tax=Siccirubricoccus deserti TaxID=2013562 RepID=A0A9X0QUI2_9PROT|nr:NAD(P)-dependent oxidoreductase [Siccirubricoccus deserti]MBC4014029.1 NAD(P)-dependent oxidoreductase [Siccirubricoccus deserti]GGC25905.1 oxidoreductase [Siccirubricoccus deserti]
MSANIADIGFIGLGQMGAPMAERLFGPDVRLHVFDPRPEAVAEFTARGAIGHASARAVADAAAIVFACLPSGKVSEAVAADAAEGRAVRVYAEMSTIGRATVEAIAARMAARGIAMVDAPISGGPAGARAGTLAMLAAGDPAAVAALRPWQLRIGARVFVLGETPGQAQVMKLVNNLVFAANMVSTCEALVMGAKAGLDADTMVAMLNAGTGRSMVSERVMETMLAGEFRFGAAMAILDKDVSLGIAEAGAMKVPMWTLEQAARVWRLATVAEGPEQDISTVIRMMEGWAGVEVRRRAE